MKYVVSVSIIQKMFILKITSLIIQCTVNLDMLIVSVILVIFGNITMIGMLNCMATLILLLWSVNIAKMVVGMMTKINDAGIV